MRKKNRGWVKYVLGLGAVLLIVLLVLAVAEKPKTQRQEEIRSRVAPLEQERDRLIAKRDAMQQSFILQTNHPATEHLIFLELDSRIYSEIFPKLQKIDAVGTLGLSPGNFPGDRGMLTREEFNELLEAGWDTCLICGETGDFASWDRDMTQRLEQAGLDKPGTVYFARECFDPAQREEILGCGYRIAVHHGEGGSSLIGKDTPDELWMTGAHAWNYEGVKIDIQELVRFRGDTCFTLSFSKGADVYGKGAFTSMLDYVLPYLRDGSLILTGFAEARELHSIAIDGTGMTQEQWEEERAEIEKQISELNEQIQELYDEWNGGKND